jgi:hypothetical protein
MTMISVCLGGRERERERERDEKRWDEARGGDRY